MTAYRESAIFIACCLKSFGPMSPKKLKELGTDPKKTPTILMDNYYGWFERIQKGIYIITESGMRALEEYQELAQFYYDKLNQKDPKINS